MERIAFQSARRQAAKATSLERQLSISRKRITPQVIADLGRMLRGKLL